MGHWTPSVLLGIQGLVTVSILEGGETGGGARQGVVGIIDPYKVLAPGSEGDRVASTDPLQDWKDSGRQCRTVLSREGFTQPLSMAKLDDVIEDSPLPLTKPHSCSLSARRGVVENVT